MTECPSIAAALYFRDEEFTNCPSDDDLLKQLDAYGHLNFVTGWSDEFNEDVPADSNRGDWLACFDYHVHECPDRGLIIAYHVVENSDSCGYIQESEKGVIIASKVDSILGLVQRWTDSGVDIAAENDAFWTQAEMGAATTASDKWKESILSDLKIGEGRENN